MDAAALDFRLTKRIARARGDVFLRADFDVFGEYRQVSRALRRLIDQGKLLRISRGLYARAVASPLDGRPMPPKGIGTLREALSRLDIQTSPTKAEQAYASGQSTQVPSGRRVAVNKRVRRTIGYNGFNLSFERAGARFRPC